MEIIIIEYNFRCKVGLYIKRKISKICIALIPIYLFSSINFLSLQKKNCAVYLIDDAND